MITVEALMWLLYDRCHRYLVTICFLIVEDKLAGADNNVLIFDKVRGHRAAFRAVPTLEKFRTLMAMPNSPAYSAAWLADEDGVTKDTGSLTGKAFQALKDMSLRRKLGSYRSLFPHEDQPNINTGNVAVVYSDLLQSVRPGTYSEPVARLAMKILVTQICSGRTSYLTEALMAMPQSEMQQNISVICLYCMKDLEDLSGSVGSQKKQKSIPASASQVVAITEALKLAAKIAIRSAAQTVMDAGLLNILLRVYIRYPTLGITTTQDSDRKAMLLESCQSLLEVCVSASPSVFDHPVCSLWTDCNAQAPAYGDELINPIIRRAAWRRAPRILARQRLMTILGGLLWTSNVGTSGDVEAYCDLIEFTRSESYDDEMVALSTLVILKRVIITSDHAQAFLKVITRGSQEDVHRVFSGIVWVWLECTAEQLQKINQMADNRNGGAMAIPFDKKTGVVPVVSESNQRSLLDREKAAFFQKVHGLDSALFSVITFTANCAASMGNASTRQAIVDAGVLALVLTAFVCADYKLGTLIEPMRQAEASKARPSGNNNQDASVIPTPTPASINAEASTLSVLVHNPSFQRNWQKSKFTQRINVCAGLVTSLFPATETGGQDAVTRGLFARIVDRD
ncbi:hypothetical protein HWV62_19609 [Athelia sp. TMB]|nr:hypothetical protein HWV62_19609 [Athelia sp. TMB]